MESKRTADHEVHRATLDVAFWLRQEQLVRTPSRVGFAPAERFGEALGAVAAALGEIPFGDVNGVEIRRITDLTVESDAPLEAPIAARARAVGTRELPAGRRIVVIEGELSRQSGECVARFSIETEATIEAPAASGAAGAPRIPASEPVQSVDNIPV